MEFLDFSTCWIRDLVLSGYRGILAATEQQLMMLALFMMYFVIMFSVYMITSSFIRSQLQYVDAQVSSVPVLHQFVRGQHSDYSQSPNYTHLYHPYNYRYRSSRRTCLPEPVGLPISFDELTQIVNRVFYHNRKPVGNDTSALESGRMSEMDRNRVASEKHRRFPSRRGRWRSASENQTPPTPIGSYGHANTFRVPGFPNPGTLDK